MMALIISLWFSKEFPISGGNSLLSVKLMGSAVLTFFSFDWLVLLLLGVGSSMAMLLSVSPDAKMLNGLASLASD